MKAVCPKDVKHKKFLTVANVMEEWLVNEKGDWLETTQCLQTNHGPDPANTWACAECGAQAIVGDEIVRCQDCGWVGADEQCKPIKHLWERILPGEPEPSGECPKCGALCQPLEN